MNVFLPPVNGEIYNDLSAEAQRITLRQPNQAVISLDTFDAKRTGSTFQFSGNRLVLGGMKRFATTDMNILWNGVNVNPINNTVRFERNDLEYECIVPEGSYDTPKKLMDALTTSMNTAIGSNIFSWIDLSESQTKRPGFGTLMSSSGAFSFLECPATLYGKYLWNLPTLPPTTSLAIGQISLIYTRWIDVLSQELTQYVKLPNTTSNSANFPSPGSLLGRFIINFPAYEQGFKELSRRITCFQNFNHSNDLQTLDISFRDEWGNPLFLYPNNDVLLDVYMEC